MAYKRISPTPIIEGGTNAKVMTTQDGVIYYNGTSLVTTGAGTSMEVLTSQGVGNPPVFAPVSAGSVSLIGFSSGISGDNINITSQVSWMAVFGLYNSGTGNPQNQFQAILPLAGTIEQLYVYVFAKASSVNTTITLNKNGTNTDSFVTIPAGTTGIFSNTGTAITFSQGDYAQFEGSQSVTGNVNGTISAIFFP